MAIGPWAFGYSGIGGFSGVGFFGAEDEAILNAQRDGCGGEPVSGLVETATEDGWGELPGGRIGFL